MTTETMMTEAPTPSAPAAAVPDAAPAPTAAPAPAASPAPDAPAAAAPATGETKTPEQIASDTAAAEAAAKAAGAPEKYADFTAAEGITLDGKVMEQFADAARALNLPQEKAQQMLDKMQPIIQQRQAEQVEAARNEWMTLSKADKEFGGAALTENMVHAKRALDTLGSPELKTLLNESGLGNHPELIRMMVKAGKAIGEEKIVTGGAAANSTRNAADRLYPTSK